MTASQFREAADGYIEMYGFRAALRELHSAYQHIYPRRISSSFADVCQRFAQAESWSAVLRELAAVQKTRE